MKSSHTRWFLKAGATLLIYAGSSFCSGSAGLIVYEGFNYLSGASINGLGTDEFQWSSNRWTQVYATSDWMVFSGGLQYSNLPVTGGGIRETNLAHGADYRRLFSPHTLADGQTLWFSFLIRITQGASWSVHLSSEANASKIGVEGNYVDYLLHARIGVGDNGSSNTFELGQNKTRFIVGRYQYHANANEQLDVWMDPEVTAEPLGGGLSTTNHIVYSKELATDPDLRDRLLISDRSIGALEMDEFRVGTTWSDVVSRAIDTPVIESLVVDNTTLHLGVERLTIAATNHVESATMLTGQRVWEELSSFVSAASKTNFSLSGLATNGSRFIRLRSE